LIIRGKEPLHLSYGLSIHPGDTWEENFESIRTVALEIRNRVAPGQAFGLALRLGHLAAGSLASPEALSRFRAFLQEQNLYVFTINGFPYGSFHNTRIKETVYQPDWRSPERRDYTLQLSDILTNLLPPGIVGSISTSPGSYKEWITSEADRIQMVRNLIDCVAHLARIREDTGKEIHLGLEPEPDCTLETTAETIAFFDHDLAKEGRRYLSHRTGCSPAEAEEMISRHVGVCFDTCHMALQFEDLSHSLARLRRQGIRISKIQLSSALKTISSALNRDRLKEFCDPVYLHQVKISDSSNRIVSFRDLPEALAASDPELLTESEWRIHYHVPLYYTGDHGLQSTASDLTPEFFDALSESGCQHLEIETYTFNVLPEDLRSRGMVMSVADEFAWVLGRLRP
jgi:sugar phosphate isomerase/epimerase